MYDSIIIRERSVLRGRILAKRMDVLVSLLMVFIAEETTGVLHIQIRICEVIYNLNIFILPVKEVYIS